MSDTITNSLYRTKEDKLKRAIDLRAAGVPLTDIGKEIGYSKAWTCKMLKAAGIAPTTVIDKNGIRRTPHGMKWTSEYYSWISMRTRCMCPKHPTYKNYGARGITLDPRWLDFKTFYEDLGPKPSNKYTIERVDNNKGYYKENCIWALRTTQCQNTRSTKLTMAKARAIREIYARGGTSYRKLAKAYGVADYTIAKLIKGGTWKENAA